MDFSLDVKVQFFAPRFSQRRNPLRRASCCATQGPASNEQSEAL